MVDIDNKEVAVKEENLDGDNSSEAITKSAAIHL